MKIQIMSDLHLEFDPCKGADDYSYSFLGSRVNVDADIVILAGDIALGTEALPFVHLLLNEGKKVIYVPGNHEFYHQDIHSLNIRYKSLSANTPNFYYLNKDRVYIDDVLFIGATLWTDMDRENPVTMLNAKARMNDYHQIMRGGEFITPRYTLKLHREHLAYIWSSLAKAQEHKTVVISHHLPSHLSVPAELEGHELNGAYASELQEEIEELSPNLWIHGHTHSSCDYNIGNTRVICNPRGYYPKHLNPKFKEDLVIDL